MKHLLSHRIGKCGLVGINKTYQSGFNYVKMVQNYFNRDNGWNIVMNNTNPEVAWLGGGYGRELLYDVYPNVLFYALAKLFPNVDGNDEILKSVANQFYRADSVLAGNYDYSILIWAMQPCRTKYHGSRMLRVVMPGCFLRLTTNSDIQGILKAP
jgi:hypothetical protein